MPESNISYLSTADTGAAVAAAAAAAPRRGNGNTTGANLAVRRSAKQLTPIKTSSHTISHPSIAAPSDSFYYQPFEVSNTSDPVSSKKTRVKSSVLDIFNKPAAEYARGYHEDMPSQLQSSAMLGSSPQKLSARKRWSKEAESNSPSRPQTATRPKSGYRSSFNKDVVADGSDNFSPSWESLPLYQAYAQAIKYTILEDPQSPKHTHPQSKTPNVRDEDVSTLEKGGGIGRQMLSRMKSKKKLKSSVYSSLKSKAENNATSRKRIFVLVTSLVLLQYNGDGSPDRLPEKVLKLGSTSVAFASDAIPGKHWVLKVMQAANDDGSIDNEYQSGLMSRLSLPAANSRKYVTCIFMIFEDGQAMKAWISTIRTEIELLATSQSNIASQNPTKTDFLRPEKTRMRNANVPSEHHPLSKSTEILMAGAISQSASATTLVDSLNSASEDASLLSSDTCTESEAQRRSVVNSDHAVRQDSTAPAIIKPIEDLQNQTFFYSANSSISAPSGPPEAFVTCLPGLGNGGFTSFLMENSPPLVSQVPDFPLPTLNPLPSPVSSLKSWCGESALGDIASDDAVDLSTPPFDDQYPLSVADALPDSPVIPRTPETVVPESLVDGDDAIEDYSFDEEIVNDVKSLSQDESGCEAMLVSDSESLGFVSNMEPVEVMPGQLSNIEVLEQKDVHERASLEKISEVAVADDQQDDQHLPPSSPAELATIMERNKVLSDSDSGVQMSSSRYSTYGFYARSSGYPSTSNSGSTSRRTSTIISSGPLPLRLSSRNSSTRNSTIGQSMDFSAAALIPPLPASSSPSPSANPLRRPTSIQIRTNPSQPSFSPRPKAPTSSAADARPSTARSITAVPIVRPPINTNKRTSVSWASKAPLLSSPKSSAFDPPPLPA